MDNFEGARRVPGQPAGPEELSPQELKRAQEEALSAFRIMNPAGLQLLTIVAHGTVTMHSVQRKVRAYVDDCVMKLLDNGIIAEEDLEIISEHLYRRMSDAQSALDKVVQIHDELLIVDYNAVLTRYKGE